MTGEGKALLISASIQINYFFLEVQTVCDLVGQHYSKGMWTVDKEDMDKCEKFHLGGIALNLYSWLQAIKGG